MIVPIIIMMDATHLANYASGKKALSVYLMIGNIHSEMRWKPGDNASVLIACMPIVPKQRKINTRDKRAYDANKVTILNALYGYLFDDVSAKNTVDSFDPLCPKGSAWRIFLHLAA